MYFLFSFVLIINLFFCFIFALLIHYSKVYAICYVLYLPSIVFRWKNSCESLSSLYNFWIAQHISIRSLLCFCWFCCSFLPFLFRLIRFLPIFLLFFFAKNNKYINKCQYFDVFYLSNRLQAKWNKITQRKSKEKKRYENLLNSTANKQQRLSLPMDWHMRKS